MGKANFNITVDPVTLRKFRREVDNASATIESFMERYVGDDSETVEEIDNEIEQVKDSIEELQAELEALEKRRQEIENHVERYVCLDCGFKDRGAADEVERCPECRGERIEVFEP